MSAEIIPSLTPIVKQLNIGGVDFEICVITSHCVTLTSLRTGKVAQFTSPAALNGFVEELRWHLAYRTNMADKAA